MNQTQIQQFYEWIGALAKKDSVDFDFHGSCQSETRVVFQKKELKNNSYSEARHLNLRVLQGEKAGVSYTKEFSKENLESCYQRALEALKLSDKKEAGSLAEDQKYEFPSGFYNKDFKNMSMEDKIQKTKDMNQACLDSSSQVQPVYSKSLDLDTCSFFFNSKGSHLLYQINNVYALCNSLAVHGENRSGGQHGIHARDYKAIDFKEMGSKSAEKALKKLNYSIPKTKKYPVVFQAGQPVYELLIRLVNMMKGTNVFKGLSLFKDSLNKKVFSESFSLQDEPLALWGGNSKAFDGEGFATEKSPLVENGILKNYLTSSFFAKALKVPHTKKAAWDEEALDVSRTNLLMAEGDSSFEELVGAFPQVLVIDYLKGSAGYNAISGDFSIESEGFLWERGEESKALCQFVVSGNIRDIFSNIAKIGKDSEIYMGEVKAPSFLVPDLMIAGK